MLISWKDRLASAPELRNLNNWPSIDASALPADSQKLFHRNMTIVSHVLDGEKCCKLAKKFKLSKSSVTRIMARCLGGEDTEPPSLTRALVPNTNIKKRRRNLALPTFSDESGDACCFSKLLESVPQLVTNLDALLLADEKDDAFGQNVTLQIAFNEFKRTLEEVNWPRNQYPYNRESMGYYSLRTYIKNRRNELLSHKAVKQPDKVPSLFSSTSKALHEIEIDEQIVDVNCAINIHLHDTLIPLRISRISLLLAIDVATDCILGYHLAYTKSPNQQDMLSLLRSIFYPTHVRKIKTPFLSAPPGRLFPSQYDGIFNRLSVGNVKLDNALMHKANSVSHFICDHLGATLNLGLPRRPNARNWVEYAFRRVNRLSHRYKSTTGSHPMDPIKESRKNSKEPPPLSLDTFEEALYILLGTHNVSPQARLGNASPLATLTHQLENTYIRLHPCEHDEKRCPFIGREHRTVKYLNSEHRAPFINFQSVRYSGDCLYSVLDRQIEIRFNRSDIRVLNVFDMDGIYLGDVYAPKTWSLYPHSIHTRQKLMAFNRAHKFQHSDPYAEYFAHLLQDKEKPKTALEVLRIFSELNSDTPAPESKPDSYISNNVETKSIETNNSNKLANKKVSEWSTSWANNSEES